MEIILLGNLNESLFEEEKKASKKDVEDEHFCAFLKENLFDDGKKYRQEKNGVEIAIVFEYR